MTRDKSHVACRAADLPELVPNKNAGCLQKAPVCWCDHQKNTLLSYLCKQAALICSITPKPTSLMRFWGTHDIRRAYAKLTHTASLSQCARCIIVWEHSWAHHREWQWDSQECEAVFVLLCFKRKTFIAFNGRFQSRRAFASLWKSHKVAQKKFQFLEKHAGPIKAEKSNAVVGRRGGGVVSLI